VSLLRDSRRKSYITFIVLQRILLLDFSTTYILGKFNLCREGWLQSFLALGKEDWG